MQRVLDAVYFPYMLVPSFTQSPKNISISLSQYSPHAANNRDFLIVDEIL